MARERGAAIIQVKPVNLPDAIRVTGLTQQELEVHFHRSERTLSPELNDSDLDRLATYVEGFSQVGIAPGDLEVTIGRFGRKVGEGRREINDVQVIAPERWQGRVEDVRAERHRRVSAEPVDVNRMLVEQPGSPEQLSRMDQLKAQAKAVAKKTGQAAGQFAMKDLQKRAQRYQDKLNRRNDPNATLKTLLTWVAELIPGGLGPWGFGDIVTAIEAVLGRSFDGMHLTWSERAAYLVASAIPVVPATVVVEAYRKWILEPGDRAAYEALQRRRNQQQLPPPQQ